MTMQKFISLDELITVDDIANLLDPAEVNEVLSIFRVRYCMKGKK